MHFPGCWVGRDVPILWPRRSLHIIPLDFFLWGYVKDIIYKTVVNSLDEVKLRTLVAIENNYTANTGEHFGGRRKLNNASTSYVQRKASMLKLFIILHVISINNKTF
jgi:hypothetical protein